MPDYDNTTKSIVPASTQLPAQLPERVQRYVQQGVAAQQANMQAITDLAMSAITNAAAIYGYGAYMTVTAITAANLLQQAAVAAGYLSAEDAQAFEQRKIEFQAAIEALQYHGDVQLLRIASQAPQVPSHATKSLSQMTGGEIVRYLLGR